MNSEANATLFSGETIIDLRDPIGTSSSDRLHQYIRDPVCYRPLQWARRIKLSLYPELSEVSGRKEFAATLDALMEVLDDGSRLKSLEITLHVTDYPTQREVQNSLMRLGRFRIKGPVTINQFIYGKHGNWNPNLKAWGNDLLEMMKGSKEEPSYTVHFGHGHIARYNWPSRPFVKDSFDDRSEEAYTVQPAPVAAGGCLVM